MAWRDQGIGQFMVPAIGPSNWEQVMRLCSFAQIQVALGYHPCFLDQYQGADLLETAIGVHRLQLSALGECGLDGRWGDQSQMQQRVFDEQIALAKQYHLPLIVHSVRCHDITAQRLRAQQFDGGGVIHGFSGSYQQACRFVDLGFKLGIGGVITWPRADKTRKALTRLPVESLVLETDAPDMPVYQMTTATNSPRHLLLVFKALHELRGGSSEILAAQLLKNSQNLFAPQ
jgi:TatD DNase family protein